MPDEEKKECTNCGNRCMDMDLEPYCAAVNPPYGRVLHGGVLPECGVERLFWKHDERGKRALAGLKEAVQDQMDPREGAAQLKELHLLAAKSMPKPADPAHVAQIKARIAEEPEEKKDRDFERLMNFATTHERADQLELQKIKALWEQWDDSRDPHERAKLQMELGYSVATLVEHAEALEDDLSVERIAATAELAQQVEEHEKQSKVSQTRIEALESALRRALKYLETDGSVEEESFLDEMKELLEGG